LPAPKLRSFRRVGQPGLRSDDDPAIIAGNSVKGKHFHVFSISETNAPLRGPHERAGTKLCHDFGFRLATESRGDRPRFQLKACSTARNSISVTESEKLRAAKFQEFGTGAETGFARSYLNGSRPASRNVWFREAQKQRKRKESFAERDARNATAHVFMPHKSRDSEAAASS
jgi:hypothetical protein